MFDELKWRYEILLDMYRGKEVTMKKELEEYKNAHPLLPVPADDPNVGKMIRAKNSAIRGHAYGFPDIYAAIEDYEELIIAVLKGGRQA